ncbi:MAG: hypothetical protein JJE09_03765 [Bacteroidia bacterium]|nr:hypothetical protein [Bacteroidia bacterium]
MRQTLFTNWHFMRWLRLGIGIFISVQAIQMHDVFSGFIAAFLLIQVVTNTGCCGASGCAVPTSKQQSNKIEEVEFDEIKPT